MRVAITAESAAPVILGDDAAGDYITGLLPDQSRRIQPDDGLRKTHVGNFDRKNKRNTFTITVNRTHASVAVAKRFALFHAEEVPTLGLLEIDEAGAMRLYMADAGISRVQFIAATGRQTVVNYTIEGGEITANPN